jgi:hypothetical protein
VEGIRLGDGGAHGTINRSKPWVTGRETVGGVVATAWHAGEAWPPRVGLGPVQRGAGVHNEGVGTFNPFPKFQSFSNIQTLSNL